MTAVGDTGVAAPPERMIPVMRPWLGQAEADAASAAVLSPAASAR